LGSTPTPANSIAPSAGLSVGRGFAMFKFSVYGLLLINTVLLMRFGNWREVLEQTGWLIILAAFEWESRGFQNPGRAVLLECFGYAIAIFCWFAYALAGDWMDFANASLWLLVVGAIAADLHWERRYGRTGWRLRNLAKILLYLGLFGIALSWGMQGDWLDAWDATLWLLCFFVIELRLFDVGALQFRPAAAANAG